MSVCGSCGAEITWKKTSAGKLMPIDPDPAADGNIVIDDVACVVLGSIEADIESAKGRRLFKSHFATCPNAALHRKAAK